MTRVQTGETERLGGGGNKQKEGLLSRGKLSAKSKQEQAQEGQPV